MSNQSVLVDIPFPASEKDLIVLYLSTVITDTITNGDTNENNHTEFRKSVPAPGGGGTSLWVRRGCAPVLGSFWPENSGIGVSFNWKISVIGVYFHSEFSGIGGYSKFCNGC